jgi:ABC-2 type transport system permease protein
VRTKIQNRPALLTAPIGLVALVTGKVLAAFVVYLAGIVVTLAFALTTAFFVTPDWAVIIGNFIGLSLLGLALITIGAFISSTTENQVVAAVGTFGVGLFFLLIDMVSPLMPVAWMSTAIDSISFLSRYQSFTLGILNFSDVLFFLSVCVVFVFLTVRVFEKRRWG